MCVCAPELSGSCLFRSAVFLFTVGCLTRDCSAGENLQKTQFVNTLSTLPIKSPPLRMLLAFLSISGRRDSADGRRAAAPSGRSADEVKDSRCCESVNYAGSTASTFFCSSPFEWIAFWSSALQLAEIFRVDRLSPKETSEQEKDD